MTLHFISECLLVSFSNEDSLTDIIDMFIDPVKNLETAVWDPFMGTGSTGVAAMSFPNVTFYGSDRDKTCVEVIINHFIS